MTGRQARPPLLVLIQDSWVSGTFQEKVVWHFFSEVFRQGTSNAVP